MQRFASTQELKDKIVDLLVSNGLDAPCYTKMLNYTMELFEAHGLGSDYYGYHNIDHELEVAYVTLLAAIPNSISGFLTKEDMKYLFVSALFHDFDPEKNVDKPHEEAVIRFINNDRNLLSLLNEAGIDLKIVEALILRTTYPWSGTLRQNAEEQINECFKNSRITQNNAEKQKHYRELGWFISVVDRISSYALGDFSMAMEMAKKNAHSLAWHPNLIVRRSVTFFEDLLNNETHMCDLVLHSLPRLMRKTFMHNVISFMKLREKEIQIKMSEVHDNLRLCPTIESEITRRDDEFVKSLYEIFQELAVPLQFKKESFAESVRDSSTILNTLRLKDEHGPIVGFVKGGPLEDYTLRSEIKDENYGRHNTAFMEPLAIRMGYWGLRGGHEMRLQFAMQAQAKKYKYVTSLGLREVIESRIARNEKVEFVTQLNPEKLDYYRLKL